MCRVHSWFRYDLELWPQSQIYRVFGMFLCPFHNNFLFDIGLPYLAHGSITIRRCDKYLHVHDLMLTFDLKIKFIGLLSCLPVRHVTSFSFHIGIPYLAHGSIYVRECVKYIHDPNTTLTFNLKVKFISLWHDFVFRPQLFLSLGIVILCLALEFITMVQSVTYIHELCLTLTFDFNKKNIFTMGLTMARCICFLI